MWFILHILNLISSNYNFQDIYFREFKEKRSEYIAQIRNGQPLSIVPVGSSIGLSDYSYAPLPNRVDIHRCLKPNVITTYLLLRSLQNDQKKTMQGQILENKAYIVRVIVNVSFIFLNDHCCFYPITAKMQKTCFKHYVKTKNRMTMC